MMIVDADPPVTSDIEDVDAKDVVDEETNGATNSNFMGFDSSA